MYIIQGILNHLFRHLAMASDMRHAVNILWIFPNCAMSDINVLFFLSSGSQIIIPLAGGLSTAHYQKYLVKSIFTIFGEKGDVPMNSLVSHSR